MDSDRSFLARYLEVPINYGQASLSHIHDSLGLPWWATIVATGIGMRAALLPVSARASAAAGNYVKSKRLVYQSTYKLLGDSSFNSCQPVLDSHGARASRLIAKVAQRPYSRLWLAAPLLQVQLLQFSWPCYEHAMYSLEERRTFCRFRYSSPVPCLCPLCKIQDLFMKGCCGSQI